MPAVNKSQSIADGRYEKIRNNALSGHIPSDKKTTQQYHFALMTGGKAMNGMDTASVRNDLYKE